MINAQRRKKVLIIRLSSLGDVVLSQVSVEILKKNFDIFFMTKKKYEVIARLNPYIKDTISIKNSSVKEIIKALQKAKEIKPDFILDLQDKVSTKIIRIFLDPFCKRTYVWDAQRIERRKALLLKDFSKIKPVLQRFKEKAFEILEAEEKNLPDVRGEKLLLSAAEEYTPKIYPPKFPQSEKLRKFLESNPEKKIICVAPESQWKTKMWSLKECSLLIKSIEKKGFKVAVVGENKKLSPEIRDGEKFFGELSLEDLIYLISKSSVVVSVDSGIMHIANALSIPCVAVFTSTTPEMGFSPYGKSSIVEYRKLRCRPCSLFGKDYCPNKHHLCSLIPYTKVEREIYRLISK
jgi:ADP-heptose:LPS heptosyltransferase